MTTLQSGAEKTKAVAPYQENTASEETLQAQSSTDILKSKSTSTETQQKKCLALLRLGPQTSYSLRANGIAQCAARIFELRAMGHVINTERVKAIDSDEFVHVGAARYHLIKEAPTQIELLEVGDE
ncbi:hypothetical protein EGT07_18165 [Herbaspirillum sp. HC18]|nr:hypothetical protein EGT07_18165 [Herbaspirillum sp. HC18]